MDTGRTASAGETAGIIMIPARLASTRLPRKMLLALSGRPLLSYAIERAKATLRQFPSMFHEVCVVGDDEQFCRIAEEYGVRSILSHMPHENGTSRIAEAIGMLNQTAKVDFVVNLQGDHPQIAPEAMMSVVNTLLKNPTAQMSTAGVSIDSTDTEILQCRDVVKVVCNQAMQATAFSRTALSQSPGRDSNESQRTYRHVGVYAYRVNFLKTYSKLPRSPGEMRENLEQLRALENQADIRVVVMPPENVGCGIDTAEQYEMFVRSMLSQPGSG